METTTNLNLTLTGVGKADLDKTVRDWRREIAGENSDSNFQKIDRWAGQIYEYLGTPMKSDSIANGAITNEKLGNASVSSDKLQPSSVTIEKIADDAKQAGRDYVKQQLESTQALIKYDASALIRAYSWCIDTDEVYNSYEAFLPEDGPALIGSLEQCMENSKYIGAWFYVKTSTSEAGSAAYPAKYEIDGANGYLNLRDYVLWTGNRLVHIPTYEAKSSTVKNADGRYSPKSGVCGLMSSTQAAYLTDLINTYWGYDRVDLASREEHYANNCVHGGLYSPITSGRPADIDDSGGVKETLGLLVIPDNLNNRLVQVGFSQKRKGYVWTRICTDKNAKLFDDWVRIAPTNTEVALEEITQRVSALEQQLGGISFGVNENGNLTYEKEAQNENNS